METADRRVYTFEVVAPGPTKTADAPRLTVYPRRNARISASAHDALGRPDHILVGYDAQRHAIMVRAATAADADAIRLFAGPRDKRQTLFSASQLLNVAGVAPRAKTRFIDGVAVDGVLVFDLHALAVQG